MLNQNEYLFLEDSTFILKEFTSKHDTDYLKFTYYDGKESHSIFYHYQLDENSLTIIFQTSYFSEHVIIKASEKAHLIRKLLENHPKFRLRRITEDFVVEFGPFIIRDLDTYQSHSNGFIDKDSIKTIYLEAEKELTEKRETIHAFDFIMVGKEGYQFAQCLKEEKLADYRYSKKGIVKIDFGIKSGERSFVESLCEKARDFGFHAWVAYSWHELEVSNHL